MRNLVLLTLFTASFFVVNSQQRMGKEQFSNLNEFQKKVYLRIIEEDSLKTLKINNYLTLNSFSSRIKIDSKGNKFVLTDLVDGSPIYKSLDNTDAAFATKTDRLQVGGSSGLELDGDGITIGVWDGGPIQDTHTEFQDQSGSVTRITNVEGLNTEGTSDQDDHGTHVTGTISARGVNPDAKGMATAVNVRSYNFLNDTPEMMVAVTNTINPIFLSNHSYGIPINQPGGQLLSSWIMGAYTQDARDLDDIARSNPQYLIVASAGNEGTTFYTGGLFAGFDKLTGDKNAKNNLVIANANPSINPFTSEVTIAINPGSSQGPTDDLRIKPDISGDGTGLFSPTTGDTYSTFSGTSMSAPNVTGSIVLLQQYYNQVYGVYMKSATARGLVCHTAQDDTNTVGPDPIFGWGLLDAEKSAQVITDSNRGSSILQELTLDNGETYTVNFSAQGGDKLSATICWTDLGGPVVANGDLNNQTSRLVNDLDIRLTKDSSTYLPWKLEYSQSSGFSNTRGDNSVDNIERIDIDVPEAGNYTLTISHKGTLQGNDGGPFDPQSQDFSLIVTGSDLTLSVDEEALADNLSIWPIPAKDELFLAFGNIPLSQRGALLKLIDIRGRVVFEELLGSSSQNTYSLKTSSIEPGVYIVDIKIDDVRFAKRIIIQ